jgi:hypothetical protein
LFNSSAADCKNQNQSITAEDAENAGKDLFQRLVLRLTEERTKPEG